MSQVAVLSANGLGDALLTRILCHHFENLGACVTLFHPKHETLYALFPKASFAPYPPLETFASFFSKYTLIILENDHSEIAWTLLHLRERGLLPQLKVVFPTPNVRMQKAYDYVCLGPYALATHLSFACQYFHPTSTLSKDNGLLKLQENKIQNQVLLHPTSLDKKRNWKQEQFMCLATKLTLLGFSPIFSVSRQEYPDWAFLTQKGFAIAANDSLKELAHLCASSCYFIGNDSGVGHLASNLGVPTLTLAGNLKRVKLWRPDWSLNMLATPSLPLPNFKGLHLRLRENFWQNFVSVSKVLKRFQKLVERSHSWY
ncbi:MAG: glycosyltransferase family 9 protein [Chlamydiae bacterium]|nr:glycosyltransferase family 9 protein [Chlamydiota bacterium]